MIFVYLCFAIESDNSICITVAAGNSDKPKKVGKWQVAREGEGVG